MHVELSAIKSLFGAQEQESVFKGLSTQSAVEGLQAWFSSAAETFKETHLLSFLRSCTDMGDAQILDVYDVLDSQVRFGCPDRHESSSSETVPPAWSNPA